LRIVLRPHYGCDDDENAAGRLRRASSVVDGRGQRGGRVRVNGAAENEQQDTDIA